MQRCFCLWQAVSLFLLQPHPLKLKHLETETCIIANFNVPVDPGSSAFMSRVVSTAQSQKAAAIVIEMNTPGGTLSDMQSIVSSITAANSTGIPTYTFIVPNGFGASAGSYIAMATNRILMAPGSAIGPSTPIVVGGTALEQNHTEDSMIELMQSLAAELGTQHNRRFQHGLF